MKPRMKSRLCQFKKQTLRKSKHLQDLDAIEVMNPGYMQKKSGGDINTTVIVKP